MMDLMRKVEYIDKKLKYDEGDRQELKWKIRLNIMKDLIFISQWPDQRKRLQQIAEKVEQNFKEREKLIKKDMKEMSKRYESVNCKFWCQQTRMDTSSGHQAESSRAMQSKMDALLRNSINQEKANPGEMAKPPRIRLGFKETTLEKLLIYTSITNNCKVCYNY